MSANQFVDTPDGRVVCYEPMVKGFGCEVQWTVESGEFTHDEGRLGVAVLTQSAGNSTVVLSVEHADGKKMTCTLDRQSLFALAQMLIDADREACAIQEANRMATRQ
jgi:hypothetical protein